MSTIRVVASVAYEYDTDEGYAMTFEDARKDVEDMILYGLVPSDFEFIITEKE